MSDITRRKFLALSIKLTAFMGLGASAIPKFAEALEQLSAGNTPVLWLQGQSCSGCSVSFLNTEYPGPAQLLTKTISLLFNSVLSGSTGEASLELVSKSIDLGGYFLVVEGSIPAGMPEACMIGGQPVERQILQGAKKAKAVIAAGACAAFGGIPSAENNPTGAMGVKRFLESKGVSIPVIALPGCPVHPEWLLGTLVYSLKFGIPPLDEKNRPKMFYSRLIHDRCPRFSDYEREKFAKSFSDEGCLFKLGCLGPNTYGDCNLRLWNSGTSSCINSGAPCISCTSENFALHQSTPFYRKGESSQGKEG